MRLANKISLAALGLMALSGCNNDDGAPPPPPPPPPATFTVGGTLSGLNGSVTLANNGGDSRALSANGAFTFPTAAQTGAAYNVTVTAQPANQTCAVTGGTGTIAAGNVSAVAVTCVTNTFTVGGIGHRTQLVAASYCETTPATISRATRMAPSRSRRRLPPVARMRSRSRRSRRTRTARWRMTRA